MLFSLSGLCETTGQKRLNYANLLQVGLNLILSPGIAVTPILSPGLENWSRDFEFFPQSSMSCIDSRDKSRSVHVHV